MEMNSSRIFIWKKPSGFSLPELIAAVAIISILIMTLVGVIRKGNEMTSLTAHRTRARAVIDSCLESPSYQSGNFANIGTDFKTIVLDPRNAADANDNLLGQLRIAVSADADSISMGTGDNAVAFKRVQMSISWPEPGVPDTQTVAIEKWITKLKL